MRFLAAILFLFPAPVVAQVSYPPGGAVDLSSYAKQSDVAAAVSSATSGLATTSALSAVQATIPAPSITVPGMETIGGAAGTAGTYRTGTAVQPRITRVGPFTTGSDGTTTVSWTDMGTAPALIPVPGVSASATLPPFCYPVTGSVTSTGGRIKCFQAAGITVTILGATLSPFTAASSGVSGSYLAIPNS